MGSLTIPNRSGFHKTGGKKEHLHVVETYLNFGPAATMSHAIDATHCPRREQDLKGRVARARSAAGVTC